MGLDGIGESMGRSIKEHVKGHMDKAKGGSFEGGRWMGGARGYGGMKWRQLYLNNNQKEIIYKQTKRNGC